jgi:hypothetical protein
MLDGPEAKPDVADDVTIRHVLCPVDLSTAAATALRYAAALSPRAHEARQARAVSSRESHAGCSATADASVESTAASTRLMLPRAHRSRAGPADGNARTGTGDNRLMPATTAVLRHRGAVP